MDPATLTDLLTDTTESTRPRDILPMDQATTTDPATHTAEAIAPPDILPMDGRSSKQLKTLITLQIL